MLTWQAWSTALTTTSGTPTLTHTSSQVRSSWPTPAAVAAVACQARACCGAAISLALQPHGLFTSCLPTQCIQADGYTTYDVNSLDKKQQNKMALQKVRCGRGLGRVAGGCCGACGSAWHRLRVLQWNFHTHECRCTPCLSARSVAAQPRKDTRVACLCLLSAAGAGPASGN